jgi:hypothetical protein
MEELLQDYVGCPKCLKKFDVNDEFRTVYYDVLLTQGGGPIDLSPRYTPSDFRCVADVFYFVTIH